MKKIPKPKFINEYKDKTFWLEVIQLEHQIGCFTEEGFPRQEFMDLVKKHFE